ncbi:MAG: hypothetical protein PWR01_1616, partial [Clostridiales bacterium]|nr:hypothetical protein [Clostridiales bacterium]
FDLIFDFFPVRSFFLHPYPIFLLHHLLKFYTISLFYKYGKTTDGYQKYLCRKCYHQFAPDKPSSRKTPKYPRCPVCGKSLFLHHDYEYYSNYRCSDKKCNHSFFVPKITAIPSTSISKLSGKTNFKRIRYPVHIILSALSMFFLGKNSFRNIALILKTVFIQPLVTGVKSLLLCSIIFP